MNRTCRLLALVALGFVLTPQAQVLAQKYVPPPPPLPVPQVTPRFNNPGPQLAIPPPGNPVQQLAPLGGGGTSQRAYSVPEGSGVTNVGRSRHHAAHHRAARHGRRHRGHP